LLKLTIHNLFDAREKLKSYYTDEIFRSTRGQVVSKRENEFLNKFVQVIENHLDDNNLDVDLICLEVAMSRTKLYSKIQELTGQPVGEFILKQRLKRAAEILVSQDISIQEAMGRVGIQSQSYFTKAFKKEFGKTPSRFIHDYDTDKESKKA
jgi:AraC-like DNA-binding protein